MKRGIRAVCPSPKLLGVVAGDIKANGIAAPLLLGLLATAIGGRTLVVSLALIVLAHLWFERRLPPIQPAPADEAAPGGS